MDISVSDPADERMIDRRSSINQGITRLRTHSFTHSSSQCTNCSTNESNKKIDLLINRSISRSVFFVCFCFFVCAFFPPQNSPLATLVIQMSSRRMLSVWTTLSASTRRACVPARMGITRWIPSLATNVSNLVYQKSVTVRSSFLIDRSVFLCCSMFTMKG